MRLPCRVSSVAGACQWTRDGYGLGTAPSLPHLPRYTMPGAGSGECDLLISPVLPLDEGRYVCQAGGSQSAPALLQVNVQPGQPHILEAREDGQLRVEQGEAMELSCQSQGGRPFAELQWRDGQGERLVGMDVEEHVTRIQDTNMFRTLSKLKMRVEAAMRITCTAHSEAFPAIRESAPMEVVLAGEPEMEVVRVCEGQTFHLECGDQANEVTADLSYRWIIDSKEVEGEEEDTLKMIDFSRSFHKSVVECEVTDSLGQSRVARRYQLEHAPVPAPAPSTTGRRLTSRRGKEARRKATVTCVLEDGEQEEQEPEYVWVSGQLERMGGRSVVAGHDNKGRKYKCQVVPGGVNKLRQMAVKMKDMQKTIKRLARNLSKMTSSMDDL